MRSIREGEGIWTEYQFERESLDASEPPEHEHEYERQWVCKCGAFEVES